MKLSTSARRFTFSTLYIPLALLAWSPSASASPVDMEPITRNQGNSSLSVQREGIDGLVVEINSPHGKTLPIVHLENPPRLVLDLKGSETTNWRETISVTESPLLHRVRLASHPDKLRVVLDLASNDVPLIKTVKSGSTVRVQLSADTAEFRASMKPELLTARIDSAKINEAKVDTAKGASSYDSKKIIATADSDEPTQRSQNTGVAVNNSSPQPTDLPDPLSATNDKPSTPSSSVSPMSTGSAQIDPTADSIPSTIKEIKFVSLAPSGAKVIRIGLSKKTGFSLSRRDERTYVLTLPGGKIDSDKMNLPIYPPREFTGFNVILSEQTAEGITVSLGVDPDIKLLASPRDANIWIKVIK